MRAAPAAMRLFDKAGIPVNIYGLELRRIEQQHMIVDGTRVIAIKGEIVNVSGSERKVPSLRFTLQDKAQQGESMPGRSIRRSAAAHRARATSFVTRVASPPRSRRRICKFALPMPMKSAQMPGHEPH